MRQVLIYRDEENKWVGECPSLPGCVSQGKTKEETIANIKEAINLYISVLEEDNLFVPEENFVGQFYFKNSQTSVKTKLSNVLM